MSNCSYWSTVEAGEIVFFPYFAVKNGFKTTQSALSRSYLRGHRDIDYSFSKPRHFSVSSKGVFSFGTWCEDDPLCHSTDRHRKSFFKHRVGIYCE